MEKRYLDLERRLEFVKNQLINIGAEDAFTDILVDKLKAREPLIKHEYIREYPDGTAHAIFHLKKSASTDDHFVSKMKMSTIITNADIKRSEVFYFNPREYPPGENVSLWNFKEAYNFLQGRPIYKPNIETWWRLVPHKRVEGLYAMQSIPKGYGFNLEGVLAEYGLANIHNKPFIMESLQKGNLEKQTFTTKDGSQRDFYISPAITSRSLDFFDMNKMPVPIKEQVYLGLINKKQEKIIQKQAARFEVYTEKMEKKMIRGTARNELSEKQQMHGKESEPIKQKIFEKIKPLNKLLGRR